MDDKRLLPKEAYIKKSQYDFGIHYKTLSPTKTILHKRKRTKTIEAKDVELEQPTAKRAHILIQPSSNSKSDTSSSCPSPDETITENKVSFSSDILEVANNEKYYGFPSTSYHEVLLASSGKRHRHEHIHPLDIINEEHWGLCELSLPSSRIEVNSPASTSSSSSSCPLVQSKVAAITDKAIATTSTESSNAWHTRGDVTPHGNKRCRRSKDESVPSEMRPCPLPALSWANAYDVWKTMCLKDQKATVKRSGKMLENHPGLQYRMRAILLDWLIEVCEVYKLHRETYYLAVDYLDRYLLKSGRVQKTHLQLLGITCLFVAAKVEEIYPPKLNEFAYVTDGACKEENILQQELLLLSALDWSITPVTAIGWLGVYMQLNVSNRSPTSFMNRNAKLKSKTQEDCDVKEMSVNSSNLKCNNSQLNNNNKNNSNVSCAKSCNKNCETTIDDINSEIIDDAFIYPQFSGMKFVLTSKVIDLCSLDLGFADYTYSVIAAAAISHTFSKETATRVSGYEWRYIESCANWMEPFFQVICDGGDDVFLLEENEQVKSQFGLGHICPNIVTDDSHIIQTHTTSMALFDKSLLLREQYNTTTTDSVRLQEASPAVDYACQVGLLTPPASSRKPLDDNLVNESDLERTTTTTTIS